MNTRYDVFISYRHADLDREWAEWLVRALETYRPPRGLATELRAGGRPDRIRKVFRDEDETAAGGALSEHLKEALRDSRTLVVICSRNTPASTWVDSEIEYFESLGRATAVLPLLVDGEPLESFPRAIRSRGMTIGVAAVDGLLPPSGNDFEPLAADARPRRDLSSREVKRRALLKVVAGALGVRYDDLYQRDQRRRRRLLATVASVTAAVLVAAATWWTWTLTDRYQIQRVLAAAPGLLPSSLGEQLAHWCRALVLTGRLGDAEAMAQAADASGDRVESLIATAEAARTVGSTSEADRLMNLAVEEAAGVNPASATRLRLDLAKSFLRQGKGDAVTTMIAEAIRGSTGIEDLADRATALQGLADFAAMADPAYMRRIAQDADDAVVSVIFTNAALTDAARRGKTNDARRLTSIAKLASDIGEDAQQPYLIALVAATAGAVGSWNDDDNLLARARAAARKLPTVKQQAQALHQIAVALASVGRLADARSLLSQIGDTDERNEAAQAVAKALARAGDVVGLNAILREYGTDDGLDRFSVLSDIAEGAAQGRQAAMLDGFAAGLSTAERAELYVHAAETWREQGRDLGEDAFLEKARYLLTAEPDADGEGLMLRISIELVERRRIDDALAVARATLDPQRRAIAVLGVAKYYIAEGRQDEAGPLLRESTATVEKVREPDLRAIAFLQIGQAWLAVGDRAEALAHWKQATADATAGGQFGSSTVADIAAAYAGVGELRTARILADAYCDDGDRLAVYTALLLKSRGLPPARENE